MVKGVNPDAYLVGEIWDGDPRWVSPGHFDGLLNYPLRELILGYVGGDGLKAGECGRRTVEFLARYAPENAFAHYLPLGSHDTERLRTMCGGDASACGSPSPCSSSTRERPGSTMATKSGSRAPRIPNSRRAFPWDPSRWDAGLRQTVQALIRLRRSRAVLRHGDFRLLAADDAAGWLAFSRSLGAEHAVLILNASTQAVQVHLPSEPTGLHDGQTLDGRAGWRRLPGRRLATFRWRCPLSASRFC